VQYGEQKAQSELGFKVEALTFGILWRGTEAICTRKKVDAASQTLIYLCMLCADEHKAGLQVETQVKVLYHTNIMAANGKRCITNVS
jgi:hypothetical protein